MIHEACVWTEIWQRWIFLPRRASPDAYSEKDDEHRGTNLMLKATEGFEEIKVWQDSSCKCMCNQNI